MELSNVFNIVSEEEMADFVVYLERVLATDEAKSVLREAQDFAKDDGDFDSADMIDTVLSKGIGEVDDLYALELASWLFNKGGGRIEIA